MTNFAQIKRSNTGKYHLGTTGSTNANCNQRMYTYATTVAMARKAGPEMLCDKCFHGKFEGHAQLELLVDLGHIKA